MKPSVHGKDKEKYERMRKKYAKQSSPDAEPVERPSELHHKMVGFPSSSLEMETITRDDDAGLAVTPALPRYLPGMRVRVNDQSRTGLNGKCGCVAVASGTDPLVSCIVIDGLMQDGRDFKVMFHFQLPPFRNETKRNSMNSEMLKSVLLSGSHL